MYWSNIIKSHLLTLNHIYSMLNTTKLRLEAYVSDEILDHFFNMHFFILDFL